MLVSYFEHAPRILHFYSSMHSQLGGKIYVQLRETLDCPFSSAAHNMLLSAGSLSKVASLEGCHDRHRKMIGRT